MCHHTPYPAIEGKHCENNWLVGLEAERADGETPPRMSQRAYSLARLSREWKQEYAAGTGSAPCLQKQLTGVPHIPDIGE